MMKLMADNKMEEIVKSAKAIVSIAADQFPALIVVVPEKMKLALEESVVFEKSIVPAAFVSSPFAFAVAAFVLIPDPHEMIAAYAVFVAQVKIPRPKFVVGQYHLSPLVAGQYHPSPPPPHIVMMVVFEPWGF